MPAVTRMQRTEGATSHRIYFEELGIEFLPGPRALVQVILAWRHKGGAYVGTAEGPSTRAGLFECGAQATIRALEAAADPSVFEPAAGQAIGFELLEIIELAKSVAVLVRLSVSEPAGGRVWKLSGTCLVGDEPQRAAVKAVLKATNRLFEDDYIFLRQATTSGS